MNKEGNITITDLVFAVVFSLFPFLPILLNPGALLAIPALFINPNSIAHEFKVQLAYSLLISLIILSLLIVAISLARKKRKIVFRLQYIFSLPTLLGVYFVLWSIWQLATNYGEGFAILTLLGGTTIFGVSLAYFLLIKRKINSTYNATG